MKRTSNTRPVQRRRDHRGLTLIEILIVIAILVAIGGLVVVNVLPRKEQADIDLTQAQIDSFSDALKQFKLDLGRYPTEEEGLRALWSRAAIDEEDADRWKGPYLETPSPEDTWGNEWYYTDQSEVLGEGMYEIVSYGPDGEEGGDDDITSYDRLTDEEGELGEEFEDFGTGDLE